MVARALASQEVSADVGGKDAVPVLAGRVLNPLPTGHAGVHRQAVEAAACGGHGERGPLAGAEQRQGATDSHRRVLLAVALLAGTDDQDVPARQRC